MPGIETLFPAGCFFHRAFRVLSKKRGGTAPFKELAKHGRMPLGTAVLNSAGRLSFKGIIYVAGINMLWRASEKSIRDSVANAMKLASEHKFESIALPLIGSGSGGFNEDKTKSIILDELSKCDSEISVKVVIYKPKNQNEVDLLSADAV